MKGEINEDLISTQGLSSNKSMFVINKCSRSDNREKHTKDKKDNLLRKFKCNFMKQLVTYLNELIKACYGIQKMKIRKIHGSNNSNVQQKFNKTMFETTLFKLFTERELSGKYIRIDPKKYQKHLSELEKKEVLKTFLNYTYWHVVQTFYLQNKDNNRIYKDLYDKEDDSTVRQRLSDIKMNTFEEFVGNEEDQSYKEKLINFCGQISTFLKIEDH